MGNVERPRLSFGLMTPGWTFSMVRSIAAITLLGLLEFGDPPLEFVDVVGGAEPGFAPGLLSERLGEFGFQLADAGWRAIWPCALASSALSDSRLTMGPPFSAEAGAVWAT